jgi:hypothetical protein
MPGSGPHFHDVRAQDVLLQRATAAGESSNPRKRPGRPRPPSFSTGEPMVAMLVANGPA